MQKPHWLNTDLLRDKRFLLGAAVGLIILFLLYFLFIRVPGTPPEGVLEKAISQTREAKNFRYQVETKTNLNGRKNTFSNVTGEKFRPDNLHIKGDVMKAPIDIYQINEKIYAKDNLGGKWVSIDINELNQDGNFMNELNPLENLAFKEIGDISYKGVVKNKKGKFWSYELHPIVDNTYMEALWTDFTYNILVKPGEDKVRQLEIRAKGLENDKDEIIISVEFYDYGDVKPVNPPV